MHECMHVCICMDTCRAKSSSLPALTRHTNLSLWYLILLSIHLHFCWNTKLTKFLLMGGGILCLYLWFLSSATGWTYCNHPTPMSVGGWVHLLGCVLTIFCSHLGVSLVFKSMSSVFNRPSSVFKCMSLVFKPSHMSWFNNFLKQTTVCQYSIATYFKCWLRSKKLQAHLSTCPPLSISKLDFTH